jgi:AAA ATPase domain
MTTPTHKALASSGLRRHATTIAAGIAGVSTLALLATGGVVGLYAGGLTFASIVTWLGGLGSNALASWLDTWARDKVSRAIGDDPDAERVLIEQLAQDLQAQLELNDVLNRDVVLLLERIDAISTTLNALKEQGDQQLKLLSQLFRDLRSTTIHNERLHNATMQALLIQGAALRDATAQSETQLRADLETLLAEVQKLQTAITSSLLSPALADLQRRFRTLIRNKTRDFVGRDFIFKSIQDLLDTPPFPSGYIVIRGEPGIGKTALLARMVQREGYMYHFNVRAENIHSPQAFLESMCAQLIERYHLPYSSLPRQATADSGFFTNLLEQAASQQTPVILLVDALDEADASGLAFGTNRLYLPKELPEGVFIIVSTRLKDDPHFGDIRHRRDIYLRDNDPNNISDVQTYIGKFLAKHAIQMETRLAEWGVSETAFIEVITSKSEGNFLYVVLVLEAIRDGLLTPTNLNGGIHQLPNGLRQYYLLHWKMMEEKDPVKFKAYDQPVICQIGAAFEPIPAERIVYWTKLDKMHVHGVIAKWHQFLNDDISANGEYVYRVYHTSFWEFLRDDIGIDDADDRAIDRALSKLDL